MAWAVRGDVEPEERPRAQPADGAHHHFERGLHLAPERLLRIELVRRDDRPQHFTDVAVCLEEHRRGVVDQPFRRIIRDEATRELAGDESRS